MNLKEIIEKCKSGEAEEALQASRSELASDPENHFARVGVAYSLKALMAEAARRQDDDAFVNLLEEFASLHLEDTEEHELNNKVAWDVRSMLLALGAGGYDFAQADKLFEAVKKVNFQKPHRYYSILLDSFVKVKDSHDAQWPRMAEFAAWWGLDNLLPEDYERVLLTNGQRMPSLAERSYLASLKALIPEVEAGRQLEAAEALIADMEVLGESHPEYQNVLYRKAALLKAMGRDQEAIEAAVAFVRKRPGEFWGWSALGDMMDDLFDKAACYSRSVCSKVAPMYQGKVRYKLAVVMYQLGELEHAKREFEKIKQIYETHGWETPAQILAISEQDWYANTIEAKSNREFYSEHGRRAEDLLYQDVPDTPVLISTFNPQKQIATFVTADKRRGFFSTKKMTYRFIPNHIYMIKFDGEINGDTPSRPLRYRKAEDTAPYADIFFRKDEAIINLKPGQQFLFVDDIYIEGQLLRGIAPGSLAEITAVIYYNIKRESWGWRAVRVKAI